MERLRRKERKLNEKLKAKREEERQNRKRERMKLRLRDVKRDDIDELQDDVINFKDSDRESVLSYFVKNGISNDFVALDTPTRLLNKSNEFLPLAYDEKLRKAIEEMDKREKYEHDLKRKGKRTKSVQIVTPRQEIKKQKEKLESLIQGATMQELE